MSRGTHRRPGRVRRFLDGLRDACMVVVRVAITTVDELL